jgi:hypothetical protein
MHENPADLEKILKPGLFDKTKQALNKLKTMGYRTKLLNQWEGVIEWNVYGYMRYDGLSPFAEQNFPYSAYKITQVNALWLPMRMEFEVNPALLHDDKPTAQPVVYSNPFDIRTLPKESRHLHLMLQKYPIYIISTDIGILSKCKFQIIDLYSQSAIVEGEKSGEEYEFHLLRFEKVFPKDQLRYDSEVDYQRFMDTNFKSEQFSWLISDIDQYLHYIPIS